ncbi:MAG: hypothetical protein ACUVR4_14630, partial [Anaerolineae bacterium]
MADADDLTAGRDDQVRRMARVVDMVRPTATRSPCCTRRKLAEHYEPGERMIQKDLRLIRVWLGLVLRCDGDGHYFKHLPGAGGRGAPEGSGTLRVS